MLFDHVADATMHYILTKASEPRREDILYGLLHTGLCQEKDLTNPNVEYTVWALRDGALTIAEEHFEKGEYNEALRKLRNAWEY